MRGRDGGEYVETQTQRWGWGGVPPPQIHPCPLTGWDKSLFCWPSTQDRHDFLWSSSLLWACGWCWWWWRAGKGKKVVLCFTPSIVSKQAVIPQSHITSPKVWGSVSRGNQPLSTCHGGKRNLWHCKKSKAKIANNLPEMWGWSPLKYKRYGNHINRNQMLYFVLREEYNSRTLLIKLFCEYMMCLQWR